MTTTENTSQDHKDNSCPECKMSVGIGLALRICEMAEVPCDDIKEKVIKQKITVQDALDQVKNRLTDPFHKGLVEETEQVMKEELAKGACISVFAKEKWATEIEGWIDDREKALEFVDPESDFAKGTKELIENLKRSREAIEKQPTCEAET